MRIAVYFAKHYLGIIVLTLALFVVLVVAVTLVENAGELSRSAEGGSTALGLATFGAIEYAYQTLPIACFVASLVAGTQLARRGEILAVQASGRGPLQLFMPFVAVVLLMGCLGGACSEYVLPTAIAGRQRIQREDIRHVDPLTQFYTRRNTWFREGDLLLYLPAVDVATLRFADPVAYRLHDGMIVETLEARALRHGRDGWVLEDAQKYSVSSPEVVSTVRLPLALHISPADLIDVTGNPREMGWAAVSGLIDRRQNAGFDTTAHRVELHNRLAYPLSAVCLVLLGLPWALDVSRRRSLAATLGAGVVFIAVELSLSQLCRLLALAHEIAPFLGAWGAPVLCCVALPVSYALHARRRWA